MNILYLLKILNTEKLSEVVANLDLPPLDINLALWDAERAGEVEINQDKDRIRALKPHEITFNSDLATKLLRVMQQYQSKETNITRGRLNSLIKDPVTNLGYPYHEYLMALHYLIDSEQIVQVEWAVPKTEKRPYHKFAFLCFPDNPNNEEWNAREVNKWIANFAKKKVK